MSSIRYVLIPEDDVSIVMLDEAFVVPYGGNYHGTWEGLRRVTDTGVVKCVLEMDACRGIPVSVAEYIERNSTIVYDNVTVKVILATLEVNP